MKTIWLTLAFALVGAAARAEPIHPVPADQYAHAEILKITRQDKKLHAYQLVLKVLNNPQSGTTNSPYKEGEHVSANVLMDSTAKHGSVAVGKMFFGYVAQENGFEVWHITDFGEPPEPKEKKPAP